MDEIAERAARDEQRKRFWADYDAAYAALQADPLAWADFQGELELWDSTLADGLEPVEEHPGLVQDQT